MGRQEDEELGELVGVERAGEQTGSRRLVKRNLVTNEDEWS